MGDLYPSSYRPTIQLLEQMGTVALTSGASCLLCAKIQAETEIWSARRPPLSRWAGEKQPLRAPSWGEKSGL